MPNINIIKFTNNENKIFNKNNFKKFCKISIEGMQERSYNYSIEYIENNNNEKFKIIFKFEESVEIIGGPKMKIKLNLPEEILVLNQYSLEKDEQSIELQDYYSISETEKKILGAIVRNKFYCFINNRGDNNSNNNIKLRFNLCI